MYKSYSGTTIFWKYIKFMNSLFKMRILVDAVDEMVPLPPVLDVLETQLIRDVGACCKGESILNFVINRFNN